MDNREENLKNISDERKKKSKKICYKFTATTHKTLALKNTYKFANSFRSVKTLVKCSSPSYAGQFTLTVS